MKKFSPFLISNFYLARTSLILQIRCFSVAFRLVVAWDDTCSWILLSFSNKAGSGIKLNIFHCTPHTNVDRLDPVKNRQADHLRL